MTDRTEFTPEWPPHWINASEAGMRSYSADSVLIQDNGILRCFVSRSGSRFVSIFGPIFMIFFVTVCWLGISDFRDRVVLMTFGSLCGVTTFGLIYAMMKHHENRGDYVKVDSLSRMVHLPRYDRSFHLEDVLCLQLLTGRDKNDETLNNSDLNLFVRIEGEVVRFHLIGNPSKDHVMAIGQAMKTCFVEQSVPADWYRSSDRTTKSTSES